MLENEVKILCINTVGSISSGAIHGQWCSCGARGRPDGRISCSVSVIEAGQAGRDDAQSLTADVTADTAALPDTVCRQPALLGRRQHQAC